MMPFGSECCKGSKLLLDLFLEYARCTQWNLKKRCTTHNGRCLEKNCTVANIAIKAFLRV